jgi:type I restriction-modification system DNA methylase subunit
MRNLLGETDSASMDKARERVRDLVERYNDAVKEDKISQFSEADVGSKFILPLLEALGWNTKNIDEVKEQKRTLTGPADYSVNVRKVPKVIVEIKKLTEDLDSTRIVRGKEEGFAYQATRYAWHLKADWCVLSNFKETRLYYAHTARPEDGLVFKLPYNHYLDDSGFQKLWLLSRESILSGKLDTLEKRRTRSEIDKEILSDLFDCRRLLVTTIEKHNPKLSRELVKESVQKILDRVLVIRVAEDRGVIGADSLWRELESWQNRGLPTPFMRSLKSIFRDFDEIYNSKLFEPHQCEDLIIENNGLEKILSALYKYNFDLISADILGAIYEDYIGHILAETSEGKVEVVESRAERKRGGIYYTPTYIVDYIVKSTLGELLKKCKTPDEVSKIKILDPACGSGSFLIKAFDVLKQWYDDYNQGVLSKQNRNTLEAHFEVVHGVEMKILEENLFGVDLDPQAAEIAAVNLMLKALKRGQKLPKIVGVNVRIGNSLLSGSEPELKNLSPETLKSLSTFDWRNEFAQIFANGGFDAVFGNPPYFKIRKDSPIKFSDDHKEIQMGMMNVAAVFLNKAFKLTKSDGYVGMIVPKQLSYTETWGKIRSTILERTDIDKVVDCRRAFEGVLLEQIIVVFEKRVASSDSQYDVGEIVDKAIQETAAVKQSLARSEQLIFVEPDPLSYMIREKVSSSGARFGDVADIFMGALSRHAADIKCLHNDYRKGDVKILRGDDIQRYQIRNALYFSPNAKEMAHYKKDIERLMGPHIVAQRIVAHVMNPKPHIILMAAYEDVGAFSFITVTNIIVRDPSCDFRYLLALLNSKLYSYYVYKFIYNNAIRSMDLTKAYMERIPLRRIPLKEQRPLIELVDIMILLKRKQLNLIVDFKRYWEPIVDQVKLRFFYDTLAVDNKEILNRLAKGLIRNVYVEEADDWLTFLADYSVMENRERKEFNKVPILKCRVGDKALRKFILHTMIDHKGSKTTGNLSAKILSTPIPRFDKNEAKNMEAIRRIMREYLKANDEKERLENEINEIDAKIDDAVFKLYGLTNEEADFIKDESGTLA